MTMTAFVANPIPVPTSTQYVNIISIIDDVNEVIINPKLIDKQATIATFLGEKVLIKIVVNNPERLSSKFVRFITNAMSFLDILMALKKGPKRSPNTEIKD